MKRLYKDDWDGEFVSAAVGSIKYFKVDAFRVVYTWMYAYMIQCFIFTQHLFNIL